MKRPDNGFGTGVPGGRDGSVEGRNSRSLVSQPQPTADATSDIVALCWPQPASLGAAASV